jgi:hypothetical protein
MPEGLPLCAIKAWAKCWNKIKTGEVIAFWQCIWQECFKEAAITAFCSGNCYTYIKDDDCMRLARDCCIDQDTGVPDQVVDPDEFIGCIKSHHCEGISQKGQPPKVKWTDEDFVKCMIAILKAYIECLTPKTP